MLWEELTALNFEKSAKECGGVCVLPLGVIEKHGNHLPLGTDMITGTAACRMAAEREPAIVFPYYFFGQIAEASHYPGTLSVPHKMLLESLLTLCDEIARNGLKKILIISSHGGNNFFLPFFAQEMPRLGRDYCVYIGSTMQASEEQVKQAKAAAGTDDLGAHAGTSETAVMMHLRPELVHMEDCDPMDSVPLGRLERLQKNSLFTGFNWFADFPNHFAGDPSYATPELGKMYFEMIVSNVAARIKAVKEDDVSASLVKEYNARAKEPSAGISTR